MKKASWLEYFLLWCITGFFGPYALHVYDDAASGEHNIKYLYAGAIALVMWLYASAKLKFFNVFRGVRLIPKLIKRGVIFFKRDYEDWKMKRGYYAKND